MYNELRTKTSAFSFRMFFVPTSFLLIFFILKYLTISQLIKLKHTPSNQCTEHGSEEHITRVMHSEVDPAVSDNQGPKDDAYRKPSPSDEHRAENGNIE